MACSHLREEGALRLHHASPDRLLRFPLYHSAKAVVTLRFRGLQGLAGNLVVRQEVAAHESHMI